MILLETTIMILWEMLWRIKIFFLLKTEILDPEISKTGYVSIVSDDHWSNYCLWYVPYYVLYLWLEGNVILTMLCLKILPLSRQGLKILEAQEYFLYPWQFQVDDSHSVWFLTFGPFLGHIGAYFQVILTPWFSFTHFDVNCSWESAGNTSHCHEIYMLAVKFVRLPPFTGSGTAGEQPAVVLLWVWILWKFS